MNNKDIRMVVDKAKALNRLYVCFELSDTTIMVVQLKNIDTKLTEIFAAIKEKVYTVEKVFYSDTIKFQGYGGL